MAASRASSPSAVVVATPLVRRGLSAVLADAGWAVQDDASGASASVVVWEIAASVTADDVSAMREAQGGVPLLILVGAATPDLSAPGVEWRGQDTYIQKDGIADDFGVFDSPDEFYARHGSNLSGLKRWLFTQVIRHRMNAQVRRIRAEKW